MTAPGALELVVNTVFVLAGVAAVRLWWRHRSPAAGWLAGTFVVLVGIIAVSLFLPEDDLEWTLWVRLLVVALLAAPYLLFRFADSVAPFPSPIRRTGDVIAVVVLVFTLAVPSVATSTGPSGAGEILYYVVVLGAWLAWTLFAGGQLLRQSSSESHVVRMRLRVLATAIIGLGLVIPATSFMDDPTQGQELATQGFSAILGLLFLAGFAPPSALRAAWRQVDERRLHEAAVGLMTAEDPADVAAVMVPGALRLLGADRVTLRGPEGDVLATDQSAEAGRAGPREVVTRQLGSRTLEVEVSTSVPLFGDDEAEQLDRLALLGGLAFERTRLLQSERLTRDALERANAELEGFVYTTSHDLKNPVLAILGYLDVIGEDHRHELSDVVRAHLDRVAVNTRHMEALIRDLLELSRVGRVDVQPDRVDLDGLIDDIAADLQSAHPRLRVVRAGGLPELWFNPTRARQLVTNLLDNAARYGGREDIRVTVDAERHVEGVRIRVRDNGVGIPVEHLERVFGVFERLDADAPGGTGMGLAICRRIVEMAGGQVVARALEDGAEFIIDLPVSAVAPAHPAEQLMSVEGTRS